jgi:Domain of unknown function (DUF4190)/Protein of unknown function (DUF2510)
MTTTGQQPPSGHPPYPQGGPPPGWYPDPGAPYSQRWWSGAEWTGYTMPGYAGAAAHQPTDGLAIASLITSLVGLSPVGIVLGFVARRRIKRSEGTRGGGGLALAGIITGFAFMALTAVVVTLAVSGIFDEVNQDDYSGEEARVANVVDRFEEAYENGDTAQICDELFTTDYAGSQYNTGSCESSWSDGDPGFEEIDIYDIEVAGDTATAWADDENRREGWVFHLHRDGTGHWHITEIE